MDRTGRRRARHQLRRATDPRADPSCRCTTSGSSASPSCAPPTRCSTRALLDRAIAAGRVDPRDERRVAAEITQTFAVPAERVVRVYPGVPATAGGDATAGRRAAGAERYVLVRGHHRAPQEPPGPRARVRRRRPTDDPDLALVIAGTRRVGRRRLHRGPHRGAARRARARVWATSPTPSAATCSPGPRHSRTRRATRASGSRRSKRWSRASRSSLRRCGAIPEVVGDAALLVDPDDVDALAAALHTAVHDDDRRRSLVARGRPHASIASRGPNGRRARGAVSPDRDVKAAITGARGFVGRHLAAHLTTRGDRGRRRSIVDGTRAPRHHRPRHRAAAHLRRSNPTCSTTSRPVVTSARRGATATSSPGSTSTVPPPCSTRVCAPGSGRVLVVGSAGAVRRGRARRPARRRVDTASGR